MKNSVQQLYNELAAKRSTIESRLEEYAGWTIPSLLPHDGTNESSEFQHDYQSFGAQAVNHLANKLMIGLFSPSRPFFRLEVDEKLKGALEGNGVSAESITSALQNAEKTAVKEMARMGSREPLTELLKRLIVLGDSLVKVPEKEGEGMRVFGLKSYVVKRDLTGNLIKLITCDKKEFEYLPDGIKRHCRRKKPHIKDTDEVSLYTYVRWDSDKQKFIVTQHIDEIDITEPGDEGVYTRDELPWIPVAWRLINGEDYGRGLVEDYAGDFHSLSVTEEAINEIIGILAMIRGLVDPRGVTDVNELNNAANGQWVAGREQDVSLLSLDKLRDLQGITAYKDAKERRLSKAFLMDTASVRDAERVTAEEIRLIARDLETSLGGVYAKLAQTLQLPLARLVLKRINLNVGKGDEIEPVIVTGLDALSRSGDMESWRMFVADASQIEVVAQVAGDDLNISRILRFIAASHSLDQSMAFNTPAEKKAVQQQRAAMQEQAVQDEMAVKAAPQMAQEQ